MSKPNGATPEGTRRYAARVGAGTSPEHFRRQQGLCMSTIGLGTYLGHWDERTDRMYQESVRRAIELGCNVIDSAINYRFQRSERQLRVQLGAKAQLASPIGDFCNKICQFRTHALHKTSAC